MLPPEPRLPEARELIEEQLFFVVHAPRQTGKTTTLHALARDLTAEGHYAALLFSCETARTARDDRAAEDRILGTIRGQAADTLPPEAQPPAAWPEAEPGTRLRDSLTEWARVCPKPLVLFFDEIDALTGTPLLNVLSQLRDGYTSRTSRPFIASAALCGLRDVRDYRLAEGRDPDRIGSGSPFNITAESLRISDFTREQVAELYAQHTADTGQEFSLQALEAAYEYTSGQPWLVNALAYEITRRMRVPLSEPVTVAHMGQAREQLILKRPTHLDSLVEQLNQDRVRKLIEPMIAGQAIRGDLAYSNDASYVRDLGLIGQGRPIAVANPIYREIIIRVLGEGFGDQVVADPRTFTGPDGQLDFRKLLEEFTTWWKQYAEVLVSGGVYHEAAPHLIFLAFLTRIVNGGGFVDTEYGVGRGRMDVLARMPYTDAAGKRHVQREAVELKVWHPGQSDPLPQGLTQLDGYLDRLSLDTGTLVIFDRRPATIAQPPDPVFTSQQTPSGRTATVLRA